MPALNSVALSAFACNDFTASISAAGNLTNPVFCLYDALGNQISCDPSGVFTHLSYGDYCIRVTDACYDTTLSQCFTAVKPLPAVAATVAVSNLACANFTATITGQANLINPQYCLYDTAGNQMTCNTTGVFDSIPYGSYCIKVHDGCIDTFITRCFTASRPAPQLTSYSFGSKTCNAFSVSVSGSNLGNALYCIYDS